ncbi:hypothetical protein AAFF_G00432970 [Aldrovandia affinis]|uniref:Uncharacterized protein n=1 Tax=Aldrovandia affinis TaxID=143900 RepID=A0AAD7WIJ1_9TELE|nr:hypothetical protein AAFF_G00432970 [Aldrovandia affinis]
MAVAGEKYSLSSPNMLGEAGPQLDRLVFGNCPHAPIRRWDSGGKNISVAHSVEVPL